MDWGREIEVNGVRPAWLRGCQPVFCKTYDWLEHTKGTSHTIAENWAWQHDDGEPCIRAIRLPAEHWAYRALDAGFEPWGGGDAAPEDWDGGAILFRNTNTSNERGEISRWRWKHDGGAYDIIGYRKRAAVLDWSKPLEHVDGTPLEFSPNEESPDNHGDYYLIRADRQAFAPGQVDTPIYGPLVIRPDGTQWYSDSKRVLVRNRALPAAKQPEGDTVTIKRMTETEARARFGSHSVLTLYDLGIIREETPAERFARETGHEVTPAVEAALAWGKAA